MAYTDIQRLIEQNRMNLMGQPDQEGYSPDQGYQNQSSSGYQDPGYQYEDPFGTNGITPPAQEAPSIPSTSSPTLDWMKKYQDYNPDTAAMDRLNALLSQAPNPEDYNAGWGRKLVAMGMAAGGPKGFDQGQKFLNTPLSIAEENFKTKAVPFETAAARENTANTNQRQFLSQMAQASVNQQKADETAKKDRETAANNKIRNDAIAFRSTHPNWIFNAKGPTVQAYNPANPKESVDLGLPTSNMSQAEKYVWETAEKLTVEQEKGAQARETKQTVPGVNPKAVTLTPAQQEKEIQNRFAMYATDPVFGKYIKKDGNSYTMIPEPSVGWWGLGADPVKEKNDWNLLRSTVYGLPYQRQQESKPVTKATTPEQSGGFGSTIADFVKSVNAAPTSGTVPRPEYSKPGQGITTGPTKPSESFMSKYQDVGSVAKDVVSGVKGALKPPTDAITNVYGQQIRPGFTMMRNLATGAVGWMPDANVAKAIKDQIFEKLP